MRPAAVSERCGRRPVTAGGAAAEAAGLQPGAPINPPADRSSLAASLQAPAVSRHGSQGQSADAEYLACSTGGRPGRPAHIRHARSSRWRPAIGRRLPGRQAPPPSARRAAACTRAARRPLRPHLCRQRPQPEQPLGVPPGGVVAPAAHLRPRPTAAAGRVERARAPVAAHPAHLRSSPRCFARNRRTLTRPRRRPRRCPTTPATTTRRALVLPSRCTPPRLHPGEPLPPPAAHRRRCLPCRAPLAQLALYGLFKQATVGDNTTSRPGIFDPKGAWVCGAGSVG